MAKKRPLSKKERRRRRRRRVIIIKSSIFFALIALLIFVILYLVGFFNNTEDTDENSVQLTSSDTSSISTPSTSDIISEAKIMAMRYDYDGAIELLQTIEGYDENADVISLIIEYESEKSNLVATSATQVTHVFFHSLIVDPERGFSLTGDGDWNSLTPGFCQWMLTIDEFNSIIEQMYNNGYVLVSIYDLIEITEDEDGTTHITAKDIYLPEGKTPFVLSIDDLSYYHSYDDRGVASKLIIGDDGTVTCEYYDADGNLLVGSYDCVPLIDDFIEEHPDFSYKGAKGTIALTGYNGIFGYRTDSTYRDRTGLNSYQQEWLDEHPDFDWEEECEEATAVAEALKEDGWTFASHTWGHILVGDNTSLETLQTDTEKWLENVEPLIGETNIIVFAHGEDIASWNADYASTEKFQYLKSQGFDIFCNVDSTQYFVQIGDEYLRMGRRNLDGYRLYTAVYGGTDRLSDLFDSTLVFDPLRPTDEWLYSL